MTTPENPNGEQEQSQPEETTTTEAAAETTESSKQGGDQEPNPEEDADRTENDPDGLTGEEGAASYTEPTDEGETLEEKGEEENTAFPAFPQYRCFKTVWALAIASIQQDDDRAVLFFAGDLFPPIEVSPQWAEKHEPEAGGYLVEYADGYRSFIPGEAFERGYVELPETVDGPVVDRKFIILAVNPVTGKCYTEHNAVLFAAKDSAFVPALNKYIEECETQGCGPVHTESGRMLRDRVMFFQETVQSRVPDTTDAEIPRCIDGETD